MCITNLADQIYKELGEPSDVSVPAIAFWLQRNIYKLNNELLTSYFIDDNLIITPDLDGGAAAILSLMYQKSYAMLQYNRNLGASGYSSIQEFKEGNRTVRRFNKTELAKLFLQQSRDIQNDINRMVLGYNLNRTEIQQIITANPIIYEDLCGICSMPPYNCRCGCRT